MLQSDVGALQVILKIATRHKNAFCIATLIVRIQLSNVMQNIFMHFCFWLRNVFYLTLLF